MNSRKFRYILLAVMSALTCCCILFIPKININEDMTQYLPDDSRMKEGVDILKANFPDIDMNAYFVKAMFMDVENRDSLGTALSHIDGVAGITAVTVKDRYSMYQLSVSEGGDPKVIASTISDKYGDDVIVEHNANSIMPDNMVMILLVGVIIVFGILFLMCSSFVEALLFILTIGMAVILNMGTNAFLPSVSMMTNTIVAVLQLVLSMDYSIILMNRFRQVVEREPDIDKAMSLSIRSASQSILSSGFTTIVGLLALVFMKFKIGLDLGLVLAKGVFFSLISIYTILPALILICYKGIKKTEKKVFLIPTDKIARFELRARVPLAILFVVIFGTSWYLSRKTELSYASIWESRINDVFPPQNSFSLLYRTSCEEEIIDLTDSLEVNPNVAMAISYPSLFKKELSAEEMCGNIRSLLSLLPNLPGASVPDIPMDASILTPETLGVLYYAASHPERDERMSFEDIMTLAEDASKSGLLPEGINVEAMMEKYLAPEIEEEPAPAPAPAPAPEPIDLGMPHESEGIVQAPFRDTVSVEQHPAEIASSNDGSGRVSLAEIARPTVDETGDDPYSLQGKYHFTKEKLNTPMNSLEMADYLGFSKAQASAAYSMAKKKNGTMTPSEFIDYMIDKVLGSKLLRKMISDKQAEGLYFIRGEMDAVLATQDAPVSDLLAPDSSLSDNSTPADSLACDESTTAAPVEQPIAEPSIPIVAIQEPESTPMDRLAEMYASGLKYSSGQIYSSLHAAGIDVADEGMIELMFTYYGSKHNDIDSIRLSLDEIIDFVSTEVANDSKYSSFLDDSTRSMLSGLREKVDDGMKMLRKEEWSMAALVTQYPLESEETFDFVEKTITECSEMMGCDNFYLVGESVMYKEMKDGFRKELLFLTLLTVISIFVIVAFSFKSLLIPIILVMTVMSGVFVNVFFSGIGGNTMLYLAYLIVQSILMGATIDYGILYTNYYLGFRKEGLTKMEALKNAYRGSIHTIMTSGLIIILAPLIMSELLTDPTICSILSSLTLGAVSAISLILFVLPAILAAMDRLVLRPGKYPDIKR